MSMGAFISRAFVALLATILAIEPAAASVSESHLWKERRAASAQRFDVASLPLPTLSTFDHTAVRRATVDAMAPSSIQDAVSALPWSLGRTPDVGSRWTGKTVIHIQDIHLNAEAQNNIGKAVAELLPWTGAIALEGEWGPLRLDGFHSYPSQKDVKRVADFLRAEGTLEGPLHALLTDSGTLPQLIGVDDRDHYEANVAAYRAAAKQKAVALATHSEKGRFLAAEKAKAFSPALLKIDGLIDAYEAGRLSLGDYLLGLRMYVANVSPAVSEFLVAYSAEKAIDLDRTARERTALIGELAHRLDQRGMDELVARGLAFRSGSESPAFFYSFLKDVCARSGVDLDHYPAMSAYLQYVVASERIDAAALQRAVSQMERVAVRLSALTPRQVELMKASRIHRLGGKLLNFSLSPEEWKEYRVSSRSDAALAPFEAFYREAEARDAAMSRRVADLFERNGMKTVVLVTGGFHAPGIRENLEKRGVRVIDWTPRITKVDLAGASRALDIFTQQKAPLESLFEGRKLFLAPRPSRSLPRAAAAVVALREKLPRLRIPGSALSVFNRLLPGAAAEVVEVIPSDSHTTVRVRSPSGEAQVDVIDKSDGTLAITEAPLTPVKEDLESPAQQWVRERGDENIEGWRDTQPGQRDLLSSGLPLEFTEGHLYAGVSDIETMAQKGGTADSMPLTRSPHKFAVYGFDRAEAPAVLVFESDYFNRRLRAGTAEMNIALSGIRSFIIDPYPSLEGFRDIDQIKEVWLPKASFDRYKRIADLPIADLNPKEAAMKPFFAALITAGKVRVFETEDLSKLPPFAITGAYGDAIRKVMVETGYYENIPAFRPQTQVIPTAMLPGTLKYGNALGLTDEDQIAIQIAPRKELGYTLLDYAIFLPLFILTLGQFDTTYFLDKHDNSAEGSEAARRGGIAEIRFWSTVALVLGAIAYIGAEMLVGGKINSLGTALGPMVHIALGALLIIPGIAYAQVKAHRAYNLRAVDMKNKPTLVFRTTQRKAEAAAVAAQQGEILQRYLSYYNAIDFWRTAFGGPLVLPDQLLPSNFSPPSTGDLTEAWWDQATDWFQPFVARSELMMKGADPQLNPHTARFQYDLIGEPQKGKSALDIGVGAGDTLLALSALGADRIDGIDFDPNSIRIANANAKRIANLTAPVNVRLDEASRLSTVSSESMDLVTMFATAISVFPALRPRMFRRIFDVLRPGGMLVMMEYPPRPSPVPGGEYVGWSEFQWRSSLEAAGFTVTIQPFTSNNSTYFRIVARKPLTPPVQKPTVTLPPLPVEDRSVVVGLDPEQRQFIAGIAYAHSHMVGDTVTDADLAEAVRIIFGEAPLPADMWKAAFEYQQAMASPDRKAFLSAIAAVALKADGPRAKSIFDKKDPASVISRITGQDQQAGLSRASIQFVDTRTPRPVIPESLKADRVAVYSHTKGNFSTKNGITKTRNEDFGLSHILPDGTVIMFTGDGMGGYGHGDQAAQLTAAGYFLALLEFWEKERGVTAALTDPMLLQSAFKIGENNAVALLNQYIPNTSAGVVFEIFYAHPLADGTWFFANYHRGDTRTEVGVVGKPLLPITIDNLPARGLVSLEDMPARISEALKFRFLRSMESEEDLVTDDLATVAHQRNVALGGIVEGQPNDDYYTVTYGRLPEGALAMGRTDGSLDSLTEAKTGEIVANAQSLAEIPRAITDASQPEVDPANKPPHNLRDKPDDGLNQLLALGPVSSIEKGPADEEAALDAARDAALSALMALLRNDRSSARTEVKRAQFLTAGIPEQLRTRVVSTRAWVEGIAKLIENTAPYFVVGERLYSGGTEIGYVIDDGTVIRDSVVLVRDESPASANDQERAEKIHFVVMPHSDLSSRLGAEVTREKPGSDYFAQRRRIGTFVPVLKSAIKAGLDIRNNLTLANIYSQFVANRFPNGNIVTADGNDFLIIDNGAAPDSTIPGYSIVYSPATDEVQVRSHHQMLDRSVEKTTPDDDAHFSQAKQKLAAVYSSAGGLTDEARRVRTAETIAGRRWDEFGLSNAELEALKLSQEATIDGMMANAPVGTLIVTRKRGAYLLLDEGRNGSTLEPGLVVVYEYGSSFTRPFLRTVDREFFLREGVKEVVSPSPELEPTATAARAFIRDLVSQKGKSFRDNVDELEWGEVFGAAIDRPIPTAMTTDRTRALAKRLFGWSGPGDEKKVRTLAVFTEALSSSIPVLHVFLHGNWRSDWLRLSLKHIAILAATWILPVLFFDSISTGAVLTGLAGNIVAHFLVSVLPWILHVATAPTPVPPLMPVRILSDTERRLDAAFPAQELLGLRSFTPRSLPLLGMSDAQSAALGVRASARLGANAPALSWQNVQAGLVARLEGSRKNLSDFGANRLAVAIQGGTAERRRLDLHLIEGMRAASPDKDLVLFIDGNNEEDRASFGGLAARSGGKIAIVAHEGPLVRDEAGGRVLDMAALEAALASSVDVWQGAAFVIPSDLSFDTRGVRESTYLRQLVFLFIDQSLRALQAEAADLDHIQALALIVARQA